MPDAPKDCRLECRSTPPLDRQTRTQIGAATGAAAVVGLLASATKPAATRALAAAGGAALGAAASTAVASYVARRRCEAICEALNQVAAGEQILIDWWLTSALRQILADLTGPCPVAWYGGFEEWEAVKCVALEKLLPIVTEAEASPASAGETWTKA